MIHSSLVPQIRPLYPDMQMQVFASFIELVKAGVKPKELGKGYSYLHIVFCEPQTSLALALYL
jgi:hypothetical protein